MDTYTWDDRVFLRHLPLPSVCLTISRRSHFYATPYCLNVSIIIGTRMYTLGYLHDADFYIPPYADGCRDLLTWLECCIRNFAR